MSACDVAKAGCTAATTGDVIAMLLASAITTVDLKHFKVIGRSNPEVKALFVKALQKSYKPSGVLMCGDGFNDVAAISAADVGLILSADDSNKLKNVVSIDAEFSSLTPSIKPTVDLLRYAQLSREVFMANRKVAVMTSLLAGYLVVFAKIRARMTNAQIVEISLIEILLENAIRNTKPKQLSRILSSSSSLSSSSLLSAINTLSAFYLNTFIFRIFIFFQQRAMNPSAEVIFPLLLSQYALLLLQNLNLQVIWHSRRLQLVIVLTFITSLLLVHRLNQPGLVNLWIFYYVASTAYNRLVNGL
jgi:magnesium-transporting ATPase (P-type)